MKFLSVILLLFLAGSASAKGSVTDATINNVYCGYFDGKNMCSVVFDKQLVDDNPGSSCNTIGGATGHKRMQFRVDDQIGQALLSIALTAYASGATINAASKETCDVYPGLFDLNYIELKQ